MDPRLDVRQLLPKQRAVSARQGVTFEADDRAAKPWRDPAVIIEALYVVGARRPTVHEQDLGTAPAHDVHVLVPAEDRSCCRLTHERCDQGADADRRRPEDSEDAPRLEGLSPRT